MSTDFDHQQQGKVSVFLGTFPSRAVLDAYIQETYQGDEVTCPLWNDLGVNWHDHDFQECVFADQGPLPIEEFLTRNISYLDSFREPLIRSCRNLGIETANAGIFLYDFVYPKSRPFPCPFVTFAGAFDYSIDHPDWLEELLQR